MGRLTTDKKVNEMSMVELAHNCCYAKDRTARYRDYDTDIDAREIAKRLMVAYGQWQVDGLDTDNEIIDDDIFDESIMENLMYDPDIIVGLIALFYRNLWAMADLREKLKSYEDIIDDPEKLKLIDALYLERCEEINRLRAECEKQTPKKVIYHGGNYDCPVCGKPSMAVSARKKNYCDFCGQKLDWSKEEEVQDVN